MGQDKANLLWGERTLLQSVAATMQLVFPQIIISVRRPRPPMDWPQICDDPAYSGPLAGLHEGLAKARTPWIFAVACDMPFITPRIIEWLSGYRGGFEAVVPVVQGYAQPLAAFYATSSLDTVREILHGNEKNSMRTVLARLNVRYINESEMKEVDPALRSFFDLDTQQDVIQAMNPDFPLV